MSVASRIALTASAGIAAAVVLAAPAAATPTVYIATFPTYSQCDDAGTRGVTAGVFAAYDCRNGFTGYDLIVEPTTNTFTDVYIATVPTKADCDAAGANGKPSVWTTHKCRNGLTGWDLLVSK
ncbi:hypothetical protein JOD54_004503 [Actinokineospora baliensis]|uniref:hypothetical protein n=1 Tax=Actinokineospora baliensis TaxID=547056 RepID=UPI001959F047|nr:hypothetical protein [Actinokineospora baliensis]MBM7774299.1 hypothetical protein [Actinokineospora baliensis]